MSLLWMEMKKSHTNRRKETPSPIVCFLSHVLLTLPCIEEIYLLASFRTGKRKCRGSMTVEAAMAVPLLILFILHLGGCMEMIRLHGRLEYALWQAGRELAIYGAAEAGGDIPNLAVSYLYVNGRLQQILGREYLDSSPLSYGSRGLNYLSSEYLEEEDCVDIVLTYRVSPQITCFPFPYFRMVNRYYGRAWTGYAVENEAEKITYVYVTEDGEVWHSRADCSYLKPSVSEALTETVWMLRNESGERYVPCSRCDNRPAGETVYLTREGNRYHTVRNCPALLRRIHALVWQENMRYRPCSRCGTKSHSALSG